MVVNKKATIAAFVLVAVMAAPFFVVAQTIPPKPKAITINEQTIRNFIEDKLLFYVWIGAVAFVVISFVVIGSYFLLTRGEPEKFKDARNAAIWAVMGVGIIVLAWSIVLVVKNILES